ncbi:MAG: hypothetical protein LN408_03595, partial [Candidatus Thermoplasmatota archaeon]|nr:hypothetical protein [Candidatus Thermoplasmatota archaeon]
RPLRWPERNIGTNCSFRRQVFSDIGFFDTGLGRIGTVLLGNEDTEIQTITSNKCSCDSIENNNDSKYYSKIISLKPGEIKTISSSIDSAKLEGFKVIKWCYEINPL